MDLAVRCIQGSVLNQQVNLERVTVMLTGVKWCHQTTKLTRRLGGGTTRWKEQNSSILHNITLIRHTST